MKVKTNAGATVYVRPKPAQKSVRTEPKCCRTGPISSLLTDGSGSAAEQAKKEADKPSDWIDRIKMAFEKKADFQEGVKQELNYAFIAGIITGLLFGGFFVHVMDKGTIPVDAVSWGIIKFLGGIALLYAFYYFLMMSGLWEEKVKS